MTVASPLILPPSSFRRRSRRRGFSFVEVMFAVIIMGVGFIMVAAMFPVAIQQTRLTVDESAAASVARGAAPMVEKVAELRFEFNPATPPGPTYATGPLLVATDLWLQPNDPAVSPPMKPPVAVATDGLAAMPDLDPGDSLFARGKVVSLRDERIYQGGDYPLRDTMWGQLQRGSLINQTDPRFGWVVLYRRDRTYRDVRSPTAPFPPGPFQIGDERVVKEDAPAAHVIVIAVQSTQSPAFSAADVSPPAAAPAAVANLQPRPVLVRIIDETSADPLNAGNQGVDLIQVRDHPNLPGGLGAVAEGAYVVISDDRLTVGPGPTGDIGPHRGKLNGLIVRLGVQRGTDTWELAPGNDFTPIDVDGAGPLPLVTELPPRANEFAEAMIVGRSLADPKDPSRGFAGPAMDVAAYSTFVRVK